MVVGLLGIAAVVTWIMLTPTPPKQEPRIEGALTEGAEFESIRKKIVVEPDYDYMREYRKITGEIAVNLVGVIRNFSGKTITGLEVVGSVVEKDTGKVIKERKAIVIPNSDRKQLENNKTLPISVLIDGFRESDNRDYIKWRITALKVE